MLEKFYNWPDLDEKRSSFKNQVERFTEQLNQSEMIEPEKLIDFFDQIDRAEADFLAPDEKEELEHFAVQILDQLGDLPTEVKKPILAKLAQTFPKTFLANWQSISDEEKLNHQKLFLAAAAKDPESAAYYFNEADFHSQEEYENFLSIALRHNSKVAADILSKSRRWLSVDLIQRSLPVINQASNRVALETVDSLVLDDQDWSQVIERAGKADPLLALNLAQGKKSHLLESGRKEQLRAQVVNSLKLEIITDLETLNLEGSSFLNNRREKAQILKKITDVYVFGDPKVRQRITDVLLELGIYPNNENLSSFQKLLPTLSDRIEFFSQNSGCLEMLRTKDLKTGKTKQSGLEIAGFTSRESQIKLFQKIVSDDPSHLFGIENFVAVIASFPAKVKDEMIEKIALKDRGWQPDLLTIHSQPQKAIKLVLDRRPHELVYLDQKMIEAYVKDPKKYLEKVRPRHYYALVQHSEILERYLSHEQISQILETEAADTSYFSDRQLKTILEKFALTDKERTKLVYIYLLNAIDNQESRQLPDLDVAIAEEIKQSDIAERIFANPPKDLRAFLDWADKLQLEPQGIRQTIVQYIQANPDDAIEDYQELKGAKFDLEEQDRRRFILDLLACHHLCQPPIGPDKLADFLELVLANKDTARCQLSTIIELPPGIVRQYILEGQIPSDDLIMALYRDIGQRVAKQIPDNFSIADFEKFIALELNPVMLRRVGRSGDSTKQEAIKRLLPLYCLPFDLKQLTLPPNVFSYFQPYYEDEDFFDPDYYPTTDLIVWLVRQKKLKFDESAFRQKIAEITDSLNPKSRDIGLFFQLLATSENPIREADRLAVVFDDPDRPPYLNLIHRSKSVLTQQLDTSQSEARVSHLGKGLKPITDMPAAVKRKLAKDNFSELSDEEVKKIETMPFKNLNSRAKAVALIDAMRDSWERSTDLEARQKLSNFNIEHFGENPFQCPRVLVHVTKIDTLKPILTHGNFAGELIAAQADSLPWHVDFALMQGSKEFPAKLSQTASANYDSFEESVYLFSKRTENDRFRPNEEFLCDFHYPDHYLMLGAFPTTEIHGLVIDDLNLLDKIKEVVTDSGIYIPIYDEQGSVLFKPEEFSKLLDQKKPFDRIYNLLQDDRYLNDLDVAQKSEAHQFTLKQHVLLTERKAAELVAICDIKLTDEEILATAARLHDIGKISDLPQATANPLQAADIVDKVKFIDWQTRSRILKLIRQDELLGEIVQGQREAVVFEEIFQNPADRRLMLCLYLADVWAIDNTGEQMREWQVLAKLEELGIFQLCQISPEVIKSVC